MAGTTMTIRFRKAMAGLRSTRKKYKAADHLREHVTRFNKVDAGSVSIDPKLNEYIIKNIINSGSALKVEIDRNAGAISVKLASGPAVPQAAKPVQPAQGSKEGFPQIGAARTAAPAAQEKRQEQQAKQGFPQGGAVASANKAAKKDAADSKPNAAKKEQKAKSQDKGPQSSASEAAAEKQAGDAKQ